MKILLAISMLFYVSCGGLGQIVDAPSAGGGVVAGAAVAAGAEKVNKVITKYLKAKYPLIVHPTEICDLSQVDKVICYIIPCHLEEGDKDFQTRCQTEYATGDWLKANPKVATITLNNVASVLDFCKKNVEEVECDFKEGLYDLHSKGIKSIILVDQE